MKMWMLCLLWAALGALSSWSVAAAVWPVVQPRLRKSSPLEIDRELYAQDQPNYRPSSVVCFFSTAMRQGDPIGYFSGGPCNTHPVSLSRELELLVALGDDGFFRVVDAAGLQAAYEHGGIVTGSVERAGEIAAKVHLVRVAEPWAFIASKWDQISAPGFESARATSQGFNSMFEVLSHHWSEIERRVPEKRYPKRSIEENLAAIADNQSCDVSDEIRDAVIGAIETARIKAALKGGKKSDAVRSLAISAICDASIQLNYSTLNRFQADMDGSSTDFDAERRKNPNVPEQVRAAILLHVKLQAKYPPRDFTAITPHRVWTALRDL
jgi:hypothetical protein